MRIPNLLLAVATGLIVAGCSQGTPVATHNAGAAMPFGIARIEAGSRPAPGITLKFFPTPTQFSWPDYLTKGVDGNVYFSEFDADQIGRITPNGTITEFKLPGNVDIEGITTGPDGDLWFTEPGANGIGRMTLKGVVTSFPITDGNSSPRGITVGPDGNLWFVDYYGSKIGQITPHGVITEFTIPGPSSYPWWITTGKNGDLWFTESASNLIGRFDPKTKLFVRPGMRVPGYGPTPWGIMTASDGTTWFTERRLGRIAFVRDGRVTAFRIAQSTSYPDTIVQGPDGNLWFTESQTNAIGRLDPKTGKFLQTIELPSGDIPTGITVGGDGNIWFAVANYDQPNSIGEIVVH